MKRKVVLSLIMALSMGTTFSAVPMMAQEAEAAAEVSISLSMADHMNQWVYVDQVEETDKEGNTSVIEVTPCYALKGLVYCENPADAAVELLDIYVPAQYLNAEDNGDGTFTCTIHEDAVYERGDVSYTAATAPIIFRSDMDTYKEAAVLSLGSSRRGGPGINADSLAAGYILVSVGSRGRDSEVDGTAPACIVDLKAAVRYLKANAETMPGDTEKIIVSGASSGGSAVALLAASGNSSLYDAYLEEIGAIMDSTDDVYGALVFCPIANLEIGDSAFEYLHDGETSMTVGWGDNAVISDMTEFQLAMHEKLVASYETYLTDLGFEPEEFQAEFLEAINDSLAYYVENYVEDADTFAEENPALTREGDTFTAADVHTFVSSYMARKKTVPGFDALDKSSSEAGLFDGEHFSENVLSILQELSAQFEEAAAVVDEYEAEITEERLNEVKLMSSMQFITGEEESDMAQFWRIRNGMKDGDLGAITGFTLAEVLEEQGYDVDYNLIYGLGHCAADYTYEDVQNYVDSICQ